jgi:D-alanyl-D-alanine carboxypeptidase
LLLALGLVSLSLCWGVGPAGATAFVASTATPAPAAIPPAASPPAKAELLVDLDTGKMLVGQNEHQLLPPASLTKMLTALIAFNWLRPATEIPVTAVAAGVSPDKVGMKAGQRWPLNISLHALLIASANDAAYALAQRIGGTLPHFAVIMRDAATQIGMSDVPVLHDPAGLDGTEGIDGGNLMSAWDLAVAARDLLANPALSSIVKMKTFWFTGPDGIVYELSSHNLAFLNSYVGAIGVKTGFTDPAGVCIAAAAYRDGRTMLAVVMNGTSPDMTAEMLLNQGFATPVSAEPRAPPPPPPRGAAPPPPGRRHREPRSPLRGCRRDPADDRRPPGTAGQPGAADLPTPLV